MRILIVEDEEKLAQSIKLGLEKVGYAVDVIFEGDSAEKRITLSHSDYDLVILDLMLPGKNGFEICKNVRDIGITIPILILTARDSTEDKVLALDNGADDFLVKPFSFDELVARIRALLRRPDHMLPILISVDNLVIDTSRREVRRGENKIDLTLKEFELLHYLARHPEKVINREDIYLHLWDFANNSMSNVIDVHIKNLRKKIDEGFEKKLIRTVRGVGYRIGQ